MNHKKLLPRFAAVLAALSLMLPGEAAFAPAVPAPVPLEPVPLEPGLPAAMAEPTAPASAGIKLIGSGALFSGLGVASRIGAGVTLNQADAALRLYFLGMITGSGTNENGGIEFNLFGGLNRAEAAVFAVRLLGGEQEAHEEPASHPFPDVPGWASDYVGYLYRRGLVEAGDGCFHPGQAETTEHFMSYMLYALGYRMEEGDYTVPLAAAYAREIGVCATGEKALLTRGGAVLAMYNILRTTMKHSTRVYSDSLVERGVISYQDAVFLLWNRDSRETEEYMNLMGYGMEWILPDGYYKIRAAQGEKLLNVAQTGMNSDFEGIGLTVWESTDDITQSFRVERTERGTYYLYSAASRYGYGRVIGRAEDRYSCGLYSATGSGAAEFLLEGSTDGTWRMIPADAPGECLTAFDPTGNGSPVVFADSGNGMQSWFFDRESVMNAQREEMAIFPADSLMITQGAFDEYSHMQQNALDIGPAELAANAPFDGVIVKIDDWEAACNAVWVESLQPVRYADGSFDYMTVSFLHDNDVSDLSVGQELEQGERFYDCGDYGVSAGLHVHVAVYRGKYREDMKLGSGDVYAEEAFFLPDHITIYDDYGLAWKGLSAADESFEVTE